MDASPVLHEKGSSEESLDAASYQQLHEKDSTEEYLGALAGIGSTNKLLLVQLLLWFIFEHNLVQIIV